MKSCHAFRVLIRKIAYILFSDRPIPPALLPHPDLQQRIYPYERGYRFNLWLQAALPWAAVREKIDILFCPANEAPFLQPAPCVVTVHDAKILASRASLPGRFYQDGGDWLCLARLPRPLQS